MRSGSLSLILQILQFLLGVAPAHFVNTSPKCFCLVVTLWLLMPFPLPWRASHCKGKKKLSLLLPESTSAVRGSRGTCLLSVLTPASVIMPPYTQTLLLGHGKQKWNRMKASQTSLMLLTIRLGSWTYLFEGIWTGVFVLFYFW